MSAAGLTTTGSSRRQWLALLTYVVLLIGLLATAVASISNLLESFAAFKESRAALARLDRQLQRSATRQDLIERGRPWTALPERQDQSPSRARLCRNASRLRSRKRAATFCRPRSICRAHIPQKGLLASPKVWKSIKPHCNRCSTISKPACRIFSLRILRYRLRRPLAKRKAHQCACLSWCPDNGESPSEKHDSRHRRRRSSCLPSRRRGPTSILQSLACLNRDRRAPDRT